MDGGALAAIGLAANILQFIDWVSHVCEVGSQIRRNGITDFNLSLERTVEELEHQLGRIHPPSGTITCATKAEESLRHVADQCSAIARDLLGVIDQFKLDRKDVIAKRDQSKIKLMEKIKTLGQAIKFEWSKDKIEVLSQNLDRCRKVLDSEILLDIRETAIQTTQALETLSTTHIRTHNGILAVVQQATSGTETILHEKLQVLDEASRQIHGEIVNLVNAFIEQLRNGQLFPSLPGMLYQSDPSLKSPALNGHARIENAVLGALTFRMMCEREAEIADTYERTFNWIFEDPKACGKPWANFQKWLREDSGCYWVEGKAGSGKSTLMKFISANPKTQGLLKEWAGDCELMTGSYFFWLAGTSLQKNQEGLLRALLHSILSKRRGLISRIFPKLYDVLLAREFANNHSPQIFFTCEHVGCSQTFRQPQELAHHQLKRKHTPITGWMADPLGTSHTTYEEEVFSTLRLAELREAFRALFRENLRDLKICFFVDGLDEYAGLPQDILSLFKESTGKSSILKMVLSSRPEPAFKEAFRKYPSLRLEDLTSEDIKNYVTSKLHAHQRMRQLESQDPIGATSFVSAIIDRASGVFLWVVIVVRSLLEGLSDGSYLVELEAIVNGYPRELRDLYEHMFGRLKPSHRVQSSKLFQCVIGCLEVEKDLPSPLRLSYMDQDQPLSSTQVPVEFTSSEKLKERHAIIDDRLRSRCCGLLEVHYGGRSAVSHGEIQDIGESRIKFLHRSVSEFLREPDILATIQAETQDTRFNSFEHNMASILFCLKSRQFFHITNHRQWSGYVQQLEYFWVYLHLCENSIDYQYLSAYIAEFDSVLIKLWNNPSFRKTSNISGQAADTADWAQSAVANLRLSLMNKSDEDPMLTLSSRYGLSSYFKERWSCSKVSSKPQEIQRLLTRLVCWLMSSKSPDLRKQYMVIIEVLLQNSPDTGSRIPNACSIVEYETQTSLPLPLWERPSWQILINQRPLSVLRSSFPTRASSSNTNFDNSTELDIFEDWATLVIMCINSGARLDKPYDGVMMGRTARQKIEDQLRSVTRSSRLLAAHDRDRLQLIEARINEALLERSEAVQMTSNTVSDPQKRKQQRRQVPTLERLDPGHLPPPSSEGRISRSASHNSPTLVFGGGHCNRCKALKTVTGLGFTADSAVRALDEAGVGTDIQALVSWLMDNEKLRNTPSENSERQMCLPQKTRKSYWTHESRQCSLPDARLASGPSAPKPQSWTKVTKVAKVTRKATLVDPNDQIVGAQWIPEAPRPKQRRRATRTIDDHSTSSIDASQTLSSTGMIELRYGNFTWILDSRDSSADDPKLSKSQVSALEEFLQALITQENESQISRTKSTSS